MTCWFVCSKYHHYWSHYRAIIDALPRLSQCFLPTSVPNIYVFFLSVLFTFENLNKNYFKKLNKILTFTDSILLQTRDVKPDMQFRNSVFPDLHFLQRSVTQKVLKPEAARQLVFVKDNEISLQTEWRILHLPASFIVFPTRISAACLTVTLWTFFLNVLLVLG